MGFATGTVRLRSLKLLTLFAFWPRACCDSYCSGYEQEWGDCAKVPGCVDCSPINCSFTAWADWFEAGVCAGIDHRTRSVQTNSNECGEPCRGPLIENKRHVRHEECDQISRDCKFMSWSDWRPCKADTTQSFRSRKVLQDSKGEGKACIGPSKETRPCPGQDCELEQWEGWSECSTSCWGGVQTRKRSVARSAKNGGRPCADIMKESRVCGSKGCLDVDCKMGAWTDWYSHSPGSLPCGHHDKQKYRRRKVEVQAANLGKRCTERMQEVAPCPKPKPVDCVISHWTDWSKCDQACGGGQRTRSRHVLSPATHGGHCSPVPVRKKKGKRKGKKQKQKKGVADCEFPSLALNQFKVNNLGGQGPDKNKAEEILLADALHYEGHSVDLRITALSAYDPGNARENEVKHGLLTINMKEESATKMLFELVDSETGQPIKLPTFAITVYDLDHSKKGLSVEEVRAFDPTDFIVDEATTVIEREDDGYIAFVAGRSGNVKDNPTDPMNLTPLQMQSSVVLIYDDKSSFELQLQVGKGNSGRKFLLGSTSSLACLGGRSWNEELHWRRALQEIAGVNQSLEEGTVFNASNGSLNEEAASNSRNGSSDDEDFEDIEDLEDIEDEVEDIEDEVEMMSMSEIDGCNLEDCPGDNDCRLNPWSDWSACSTLCGVGIQTRDRDFLKASSGRSGCSGALKEVKGCTANQTCVDVDCVWGDWHDWSACSCTCDGGSRERERHVKQAPRGNGKPCDVREKAQVEPCHQEPCRQDCQDGVWGSWQHWSPCSATCGKAYRQRRRIEAQAPNHCGLPVTGVSEEFENCAELPSCTKDVDCGLSQWADWSFCSCSCFGIRERSRYITHYASGKGKPCNSTSLKMVESCNPAIGVPVPNSCGGVRKVQDCTLSDWSDWSDCSRTCGGGRRTKSREVLHYPTRGGRTCEESLEEVEPCRENACEKEVCLDCVWSKWSDWSECSNCGEPRYRHRHIEELPNKCGKMCDVKIAKEVDTCTSNCDPPMYCSWTDWSGGQCEVGCGRTFAMSTRALGVTKEPHGSMFSGMKGLSCSGSQVNVSVCDRPSCEGECVPRHCQFTPWSDWSDGSCLGLCERKREISRTNNECGDPCSGALLETQACQPNECRTWVNCKLSDWSEWSGCDTPFGQRFQERRVSRAPKGGGEPCGGHLRRTDSCEALFKVRDCMFSDWGDWNMCSQKCGGGLRTRSRHIHRHARNGGKLCEGNLKEMDCCNTEPCKENQDCTYEEWASWSDCGQDNTRLRKRGIDEYARGEGTPCLGVLEEMAACNVGVKNCKVSEWTEWDECDQKCGGGQKSRSRSITEYPERGGTKCPSRLEETVGCNTDSCDTKDCEVSPWKEWGQCSSTCGTGQQTRDRQVLSDRDPEGKPCSEDGLTETRACKDNPECDQEDCKWGNWEKWGDCTRTCGGGVRTRIRGFKTAPGLRVKPCEVRSTEEIEACSMKSCDKKCVDGEFGDWGAWSPCSATCGGGVTFRTRFVARMADHCGKPAIGPDRETKFCNVEVPCEAAVNCEFSEWSPWSVCSATCSGVMSRSRHIQKYGRGTGVFCDGELNETFPCNPVAGAAARAGCAKADAVDCAFDAWQTWSDCSADCGGGMKTRERAVAIEAKHGGQACTGATYVTKECARKSCGSASNVTPVDCVLGDWQEWSACSSCDGQRKRLREIVEHARHGGQNCNFTDLEEQGGCPRRCHGQHFCTWGQWSSWTQCTGKCGGGRRSRHRELQTTSNAPNETLLVNALPENTTSIEQKYEVLFAQTESLHSRHMQELTLAFVAGFSCLLAVGVLMKRLPLYVRSTRHVVAPMDEEMPLAGEVIRGID